MKREIPAEVKHVTEQLEQAGFEAYIVGGCVRDLLLGREPEDWDITTNAAPEQIQQTFPDSFYANKFFTVTVLTGSQNLRLKEIEVTTYRAEHSYTDRRRPEEVRHAETLQEDLSRRDFTINAIALRLAPLAQGKPSQIIDPFEGQRDLKAKLIRAVGNPEERFAEDALRMMRAARIATTLEFAIEENTRQAIQKNAAFLKEISAERIRDELIKMVMPQRAMQGIELLRELKLLEYIMPELGEGIGVTQNKHHKYTVWEHNLLSLDYAAKQQWGLEVRLAALLHDVAKPRVKQGEGPNATFYTHEHASSKLAKTMLSRLKFPRQQTELIAKLVRYHMFYYNVDEVSEHSVRRLVRKVGAEHMQDLLRLRMADRIGSGVPKAQPYKLRHWQYMIEKVSQDPLSVTMLKINGDRIMELLDIDPGPKIGWVLHILFGEVLEDPQKNDTAYLEGRAQELNKLADAGLQSLAKRARQEMESVETAADETVKQKYWVK